MITPETTPMFAKEQNSITITSMVIGSMSTMDMIVYNTNLMVPSSEKPTSKQLPLTHSDTQLHQANLNSFQEQPQVSTPSMVTSTTLNSNTVMILHSLIPNQNLENTLKPFQDQTSSNMINTSCQFKFQLKPIPDGVQFNSNNGMENTTEYSNGPLMVGLELKVDQLHSMNSSD